MATPTLNSRPEKTIDGFLSRWNASDLPIIYSIANTKWPLNSDSEITVTAVNDVGGYAELDLAMPLTGIAAKDWVQVDVTNYVGIFKIRSFVSTSQFTIDAAFVGNGTGDVEKYYNNYTTRIRIYVGIDPTHTLWVPSLNYELIGTIDQKPGDDNNTLVDIRKYVKSKLIPTYLASGNDLNAWKDFYIEYAETYDEVNAGIVEEFVSQFASDAGEWCHASYSSLQFGNARGGNMYDYTVSLLKSDLASWMTDFERPKIYNLDEFSLSIIMNSGSDLYGTQYIAVVDSYNINGTLLVSKSFTLTDQGYGVCRLNLDYAFIENFTEYLTIQLELDNAAVTNNLRIDIDNLCIVTYNLIDSDGVCIIDSDGSQIVTL